MKNYQLFSRRDTPRKTDFRPADPAGMSPFAQLRRLQHVLTQDVIPAEDYTDMPDAIEAYREYIYRKVFTGTSHEQFKATEKDNPEIIDWLIAVASVDQEVFRATRNNEKRGS
jgi:hypothetical protein